MMSGNGNTNESTAPETSVALTNSNSNAFSAVVTPMLMHRAHEDFLRSALEARALISRENNASSALTNENIIINSDSDDGNSLDSFSIYQIRRIHQNSFRLLYSDADDEDSIGNASSFDLPAAFNETSSSISSISLSSSSSSSSDNEFDEGSHSTSVNMIVDTEVEVTNNNEEGNIAITSFVQNPSSTTTFSPRISSDVNLEQRIVAPSSTVSSLLPTADSTLFNTNTDFNIPRNSSFELCAKRKLSSPESNDFKKTSVLSCNPEEDVDESMCCSICFESWTNSGSHRLTSLKCGHIFGKKCIEKWLKESQKCPQCNSKAKKSDLRLIYAKKLITLDTVELDHALQEADKECKKRRECEMELAKVRMQYHMSVEQCERLKTQVSDLQMQLTACKDAMHGEELPPRSIASSSVQDRKSYRLLKDIVVTQSGGCRVMDFHSKTQQFVVSQPSPHANFMTGFGVKRISACEMKGGYFTLLHQKPIKDLRFSRLIDHHLLSASQDGNLRITDLMSNARIHEYKIGKPVWSCCWDAKDRNVMYAGLSNGSIMQFDLRNTSECLSSVENANSKCPIVSLYHVPPTASDHFQGRGGLLTGTLDGASFWQDTGSRDNEGPSPIADFKPVLLPLEPGSCTGVQYCRETQCFLTTFRPGRSYRNTTHLLCELKCLPSETASSGLTCNVVGTYTGGQLHKMLTRNAIFVLPESLHPSSGATLFVCVGDEALRKVQIYDSSQDSLFQTLNSSNGLPLDILPVHVDDQPAKLAVLSQNNLQLFQLG